MTEREKIAQIIAEHLCPQGRAHKTLYGAARRCYSRNNFADCEKVSDCVDALIAAGFGDVTEWKEQVECAKRILQIPTLPNGTTDLSYFEYKGERIQDIACQRDEYRHRTEVAKRALLRLCEETMRDKLIIMYPIVGRQVRDKQELYDYCIEQAERELAEGGKDG